MGYESSCDAYIEPKGNGVLDTHENVLVFAYLQVNEILVILTPKECDQDVHKAKWLKWENNPSYKCGQIDECELCLAHNIVMALCSMFMKSWAILGFNGPVVSFRHNNIGDMGCNYMFNYLFLCVWCVTKWKHPLTHLHLVYKYYPSWCFIIDGVWICWFIEFYNVT